MSTLIRSVETIILRDLDALRREVDAYPDDASLWEERPGLPNSAGTLVLHLAGNLQHFLGTVFGKTSYVRDRDAEFARRGVSRDEMRRDIDAAKAAVKAGLAALRPEQLEDEYPLEVAKRRVRNGDYLVHLATHLSYHLGQVDYHRRVVTGDRTSLDTVSPKELPV